MQAQCDAFGHRDDVRARCLWMRPAHSRDSMARSDAPLFILRPIRVLLHSMVSVKRFERQTGVLVRHVPAVWAYPTFGIRRYRCRLSIPIVVHMSPVDQSTTSQLFLVMPPWAIQRNC